MHIDEACINRNAVKIIEELVSPIYDYCNLTEEDAKSEHENASYAFMTLGNICGVVDMARALKEELKKQNYAI